MRKIWLYGVLSVAALLFTPAVASAQQLTCESRNYQQEFCQTGMTVTRAWLVTQRSRAPCIEGQTWGFQGNTIWVTQGCEGDFGFQGVGGPPVVVPGPPGTARITCESRNYQQQYCPTGQQITSAWVIEQRSSAPCVQGRSWGFQGGDIWVTEGCAADFGVQGRGGPPVVIAPQPVYPATMVCASIDYQQNFCATARPISRAWLIAQRSRSACIQGSTWGYDQGGVWVTQGCEGEFGFE